MNKLFQLVLAFLITGTSASCSKKNTPALPDNLIQFTSDKQGFDTQAAETEIKVNASRAVDVATAISIKLQSSGVTYGKEYTTNPAANNHMISLTIPAGSSTASFKIIKAASIFLNGNENIEFTITEVPKPTLPGSTLKLELSFSAITSTGSQLQLEGGAGGASAENTVFVDLSANRQTPVLRDSWDLGFHNGSSFRVIINSSNGASAIQVDKTDLNAVSSADIDPNTLILGLGQGSFDLYDDISGDLNKTAIAEVAANAADNKVYVINRKGGSGSVLPADELYKIRIIRKDAGYTLQYAKLNETTFKTLDISKNTDDHFGYVSFLKGLIQVEPAKDRWDFQWGWSMYATGGIPYGFSDLVFLNTQDGVQAAEVIIADVASYANFKESDLGKITLSNARDIIGSKWRVTSGGTVGVKTDRFYVIKDSSGNIYKLKFVSFHANDGGERGKPVIEYALVKKGA